ncbi:Putative Holin-X, holin superfamily III [Chitinophaga costaii]|uniref:Putative Holin-X, holin superfamily III n=1 Tax=Chitinophaga costaii TaxID=1335309 RepID=A0A1C4AEV3_9BACT|nr:phage holin family protein [Chitinophaga costaii]PUZ26579.1 hypothetical protein DCM91_09205 [Chitinophaga costaii]SCB93172.1 Putative Holin-X, holin superfamily III [Chitinophaga costaii]
MEDNFSNYFQETGKTLKEYLQTRVDLIRLQAAGKLSRTIGILFSMMLAFLLFFFVIVFLGMVLGFFIGEKTGSFTIGFSCSAGAFLVLMLIMYLVRKQVQRGVANLVIGEILREEKMDDLIEKSQDDPEAEAEPAVTEHH